MIYFAPPGLLRWRIRLWQAGHSQTTTRAKAMILGTLFGTLLGICFIKSDTIRPWLWILTILTGVACLMN